MKHFILLFALIFSSTTLAQDPEWGRLSEAEKKAYDPVIVGEDEDAIYTVYRPMGKMFKDDVILFEKFDKRKLNQKYSKWVTVPKVGRKQYQVEKISLVNGNFIVFASYYNKKTKEFSMRAFPYSTDKLRKEKDIEIYTSEVEKRRRQGDFKVVTSKNRETILVHYHTYYKKKDQTIEVLKLYDKEMNELVAKSYVADGDQNISVDNILLDDEGSVYYLNNNAVVILDVNSDYEEWTEPIVAEGIERNGELNNYSATLNSENDLIIVANYVTKDLQKTNEKKRRKDRKRNDTQVEGVYFMRLNTFNKETEVAVLNKFDQDFIDQFKTERDLRKGRDVEMNNIYNTYNFFFKDDGGAIFVAERQFVVQYYSYDRNGMQHLQGEDYNYNDLVSFNFDPEGNLVWANRIPKQQTFYWRAFYLGFYRTSVGYRFWNIPWGARGHFSYVAGLSDDKFYIIYNDHKKNVELQNTYDRQKTMTKIKKAIPVVYSVDLETGIRKKEMNLRLVSSEAYFKPGVHFQTSQTEPLYIFGSRKKNFRLGKIDFSQVEAGGKGRRARKG